MLQIEILDIVLLFILSALVAGNNLSAAMGTLVGSRTLSKTGGVLLGIIGYSVGFLTEGSRMNAASASLLPHSYGLVASLFLATIIIFIVAEIVRSPLSLTMVLIGVSIGLSIRNDFSVNYPFVEFMIITWVLAPVIAIAASYYINRRVAAVRWKSAWNVTAFFRIALVAAGVFTAFTLGANTIGLIGAFYGFNYLAELSVVGGIIFGCLLLSGGVLRRVGEDMYALRYSNALVSTAVSSIMVEAATVFGVPLSNTQTLTSSVFGSGLSYRMKAIFVRPFLLVVLTWVVSPLVGLALGFVI